MIPARNAGLLHRRKRQPRHNAKLFFVWSLLILSAFSAGCRSMPEPDGVLIYASPEGVVANDLKTGDVTVLVEGRDLSQIAVDRQGSRLLYVEKTGDYRTVMLKRIISGKSERVCVNSDYSPPWAVQSPAIAPSGALFAFIARDVLGEDRLEVSQGPGECLTAATYAPAVAWAPGDDRLLVTDGNAVAVQPIVDRAHPWQRPKGGLPSLVRFDGGGVKALAVNRNMDKYAVARNDEVSIFRFDKSEPVVSINTQDAMRLQPVLPAPAAIAFSPDEKFMVLSCGPESDPSLWLVSATGKNIHGRKKVVKWDLHPMPKTGSLAWMPVLVTR
jgi:hypothetical protein